MLIGRGGCARCVIQPFLLCTMKYTIIDGVLVTVQDAHDWDYK